MEREVVLCLCFGAVVIMALGVDGVLNAVADVAYARSDSAATRIFVGLALGKCIR